MDMEKKLEGLRGPLLLFDGVCNLCNGYVQFVLKRDHKNQYLFSPLQSEIGRSVLESKGLPSEQLSSVLLYKNGKLYDESDVALEITKDLKGLWPILYVFKLIPKFIRNPIYRWIARNRYRWFGQSDACMVPTPDLQERFIV